MPTGGWDSPMPSLLHTGTTHAGCGGERSADIVLLTAYRCYGKVYIDVSEGGADCLQMLWQGLYRRE